MIITIACIIIAVFGIGGVVAALILMHMEHKVLVQLIETTNEQANTLIAQAIERERVSVEELREAVTNKIEGTPPEFNNVNKVEYEGGFNPHDYTPIDDE